MKISESSFIKSCTKKTQYPDTDLPEIAFAGRSNVGKSSLINMLLGRKNLAKTGGTPGKTQLINFFDIDGLFRVVDLPGYGFAKVSKTAKLRWGEYIEEYLSQRENLLEVFLLVDARRVPNEHDKMMYDYIRSSGFSGYLFCTKMDKLKRSEINPNFKKIMSALKIGSKELLIPVSNTSRSGKYEAWDIINDIFSVNRVDIKIERQSNE